ncbi:phosphate ABC transporter permease PstA [Acanthopleuribacter pedis]|uniref:Phosphate transport system permease protein PstA n=1 Tax=Acanthopleuribacter pedis TaxID=442870 RepID=A0A8J7Q6L9_9BACT|nr:phosphate ABC transporter permease PstA [Acanthopleuribacter pedis]MBO1319126.1 phosphate ABC transporter permease PstA [Acanthopleuribacter pedis]
MAEGTRHGGRRHKRRRGQRGDEGGSVLRRFPFSGLSKSLIPYQGDGLVWVCAAATSVVLLLYLLLLGVITTRGLSALWVKPVVAVSLIDGRSVLGHIEGKTGGDGRWRIFRGNREVYGHEFSWIDPEAVTAVTFPEEVTVFERVEYGRAVGYLRGMMLSGSGEVVRLDLEQFAARHQRLLTEEAEALRLLGLKMAKINLRLEDLRLKRLKAMGRGRDTLASNQEEEERMRQTYLELDRKHVQLLSEMRQKTAVIETMEGTRLEVPMSDILRFYQPNQMNVFEKMGFYLVRFWALISENPRESNTEGGLFPVIFGTLLLVLLMSVFCVPFGVVAAIYLHEYAGEGWVLNTVRLAVHNLASIPGIVYGIFGLGFFVYGLGGWIDRAFFPERLPIPTFGTGGVLWAGLTMALLTLPVVIVSTEEGLRSVPRFVKDGSLALGATKLQTLRRVTLPMAMPGIMTGFILAITRAAGEVAPIMIVGVVKMAPMLPIDDVFPFFHFERKFMHLGFHIYDAAFQSPNVEAALPLAYVTTTLLLLLVLSMSLVAMYFRAKLRERFTEYVF